MQTLINKKSSIPENWSWNNGIGFLPFGDKPVPYDEAYFEKYVVYSNTRRGEQITNVRCDMVDRHLMACKSAKVLDVGIGCGSFVAAMRGRGWSNAYGTDINPVGLHWLELHGWKWNEADKAEALTFWDVLEHIPDPQIIFNHHRPRFIFICMPVYRDEAHVFTSKHYRPGEHCWYFTVPGLLRFMKRYNYICAEMNDLETELGREDIFSFAFRRG